jgi:tRNA(Ile2) C34 agmatinyltransferase TiaS
MNIGIVGFRCPLCGHKITEAFKTTAECDIMDAWRKAREKFDRHMDGPSTQEERDMARSGDDCNG